MTFFLICGGIGFVLLMISLLSGHDSDLSSMDHDFDHGSNTDHSLSIFSFRTIMVFLTAFGAIGTMATYFGFGILWSSIGGVSAGIIFGFISWWMMNFAMKQQSNSLIDGNDLAGKSAIVHISIPINGIGEIAVQLDGRRKYLAARASDNSLEIKEHTLVKILENSSGTAIVQTIQ